MGSLIFGIVFLAIYFIPTFIAYDKKRHNDVTIFLINLVFGWTLIGWFIALVMATSESTVVVQNNKSDADELEKLHSLKVKGVITEEEYKKKKAEFI